MKIADGWQDYSVIATGNGEKLERWGEIKLLRPEPQAIWKHEDLRNIEGVDGIYTRSSKGGGAWDFKKKLPKSWTINYRDLTFSIMPMGFKHTGLFPEQAANWDMMRELIESAGRPISVLNLFAYTGGATVACLASGASVCHVDAAKGMVERAAENIKLSHLEDRPVRYIVDDCFKFVQREIRRGRKYDAVIMDPPSYGRGPGGEVWKLEDGVYDLIKTVKDVLSEKPLFVLINSYTTGLQPTVLRNLLTSVFGQEGKADSYELCLPTEEEGILLPCGASGIYIFNERK